MKSVFILFFLLAWVVSIQAQTAETDKKDQSLISLSVVVSDREGRYIPDLKKEDFTVYQNGAKREIKLLETYNEPINIALLLDTSGSIEDVAKKIKSAAKDFVGLLNPQDKCLIATFDNQVKILNSFTSDQKILENSLDKIASSKLGGTLMYNAVSQTTRQSFAAVEGRKVVVILTDGKDFGSVVTKQELLDQFEESDVLIYSVFYKTGAIYTAPAQGKKAKKDKKQKNVIAPTGAVYVPTEDELTAREKTDEAEAIDALKKMADATAGRFYMSDVPGLKDVFRRMAGELREQYRIGYVSKDVASQDVIVKVARPDAVVRVRGNGAR